MVYLSRLQHPRDPYLEKQLGYWMDGWTFKIDLFIYYMFE